MNNVANLSGLRVNKFHLKIVYTPHTGVCPLCNFPLMCEVRGGNRDLMCHVRLAPFDGTHTGSHMGETQ